MTDRIARFPAGALPGAVILVVATLAAAVASGCAKPASSGWAQNSKVIEPSPAIPTASLPQDQSSAVP